MNDPIVYSRMGWLPAVGARILWLSAAFIVMFPIGEQKGKK